MIPDHVNLLQAFRCILVLVLFITSCGNPPETFKSVCNKNQGYQKIELSELIKKIEDHDDKYVEVEGKYNASLEESVLYATGFFSNRSPIHGLWIDFDTYNLQCPLNSEKTGQNLFEKGNNDIMYNRIVRLHGQIDIKHKGHLGQYSGILKKITLVDIK